MLDHYDYFVKLVGIDHVGIGTDTQVGDHVGFHRVLLGRNAPDSLPGAVPGRPGVARRRLEHHPRPDRPRLRGRRDPQDRRPERARLLPAHHGLKSASECLASVLYGK